MPTPRRPGSSDAHRYRLGTNHTQLPVNNDYVQAGDLYRLMSEEEKKRLVDNIGSPMQKDEEGVTRGGWRPPFFSLEPPHAPR